MTDGPRRDAGRPRPGRAGRRQRGPRPLGVGLALAAGLGSAGGSAWLAALPAHGARGASAARGEQAPRRVDAARPVGPRAGAPSASFELDPVAGEVAPDPGARPGEASASAAAAPTPGSPVAPRPSPTLGCALPDDDAGRSLGAALAALSKAWSADGFAALAATRLTERSVEDLVAWIASAPAGPLAAALAEVLEARLGALDAGPRERVEADLAALALGCAATRPDQLERIARAFARALASPAARRSAADRVYAVARATTDAQWRARLVASALRLEAGPSGPGEARATRR